MIAPSSSNAAQAFAVQLEHVDRARPRADARPMLEEPKIAAASHQFGRLCANASDLPPPVRCLARLLPWDSRREMHRAVTDRGACKSDPGREEEFRHHAPRLHALSAPRSVAHHSYHPWVTADAKLEGMVNGDPSPFSLTRSLACPTPRTPMQMQRFSKYFDPTMRV